jgi:hypothetical protein
VGSGHSLLVSRVGKSLSHSHRQYDYCVRALSERFATVTQCLHDALDIIVVQGVFVELFDKPRRS